jgi:hypothetical protein
MVLAKQPEIGGFLLLLGEDLFRNVVFQFSNCSVLISANVHLCFLLCCHKF